MYINGDSKTLKLYTAKTISVLLNNFVIKYLTSLLPFCRISILFGRDIIYKKTSLDHPDS